MPNPPTPKLPKPPTEQHTGGHGGFEGLPSLFLSLKKCNFSYSVCRNRNLLAHLEN
ncbi:hypothetical protein HBZC1_00520 [Helicobacter bizzozeronii CIII-1]|uniref:Uncharacterized protein n=1 Tax=Helicobacter bizzozeronii (strain CIII-1) TaxID=1002804 RepID=F8KQN4_HELBC|nr:hypothetical protein HBZC1_00520 [Helicobacter bizzozeronii CIII-1]